MNSESIALQEANELHNLQYNATLMDYGLHMGLMERTAEGKLVMELLNMKVLSPADWWLTLFFEISLRLMIFVTATSLVKLAIDSHANEEEREEKLKFYYALGILVHQFNNFDSISIRTINRLLVAVAITLFSLTTTNNPPCEHMKRFKDRIRHRLTIDYYLWCLLFAMDFVLTCTSVIHISLEHEYGTQLNITHIMLSSYCVVHLSGSMQLIGNGKLTPIIVGTPLLFLDAGYNVTLAKGLVLFLYYLCFWCSDWRELVDWNHPMMCEAGVCRLLCNQQSNLRQMVRAAKYKFDMWRVEEGLDNDGWFLLLDPPSGRNNRRGSGGPQLTEAPGMGGYGYAPAEGQQIVDYTNRMIYLPSRNPLLTSLTAIILMIWK